MSLAVEPVRVVFVCTHNSARSIMAEALLRELGGPEFEARSAGTRAAGIRALTLRVLRDAGIGTDGLRSKSIDELLDVPFDYVVTVCDDAKEVCPVFPGGGQRLHWSLPDPSTVIGTDQERHAAFASVFATLESSIERFVASHTAAGDVRL